MMPDEDMNERAICGRRGFDGAHLLKWIPFLSLLFLLGLQTVYVTRYVSGLEASNSQLLASVSDLKAEFKQLSLNFTQGAVPSAQAQWRIDQMERQVSEMRQVMAENSRRMSVIELRVRANGR